MLKKMAAGPYLFWAGLFIVVPLFLVLYFSLNGVTGGFSLDFSAYRRFLDPIYISVLANSVRLAFWATAWCLLLGYPLAMLLTRLDKRMQSIAVLLFLLPMWMNFLLRTYAWMAILANNGFLNRLLAFLRLPAVNILYTEHAILLGMVYNFLPFMVLPIYTVLMKIDPSLIEAAEDLGAGRWTVLRRVTVPLSLPGIVTGITMVFMPAVSTFVISALLGGNQYMLIGNLIEQQFIWVGDWQFGSALSVILMVMILASMAVLNRMTDQEEERGSSLW